MSSLSAPRTKDKRKMCEACGKRGHIIEKCWVLYPKKKVRCDECGKRGHTIDRCWALHPELQPKGKGIFAKWNSSSNTLLRLNHYAHIYIGPLLLLKACESKDKIDVAIVRKYCNYTLKQLDAFFRGEDGSSELGYEIQIKVAKMLEADEVKKYFDDYGKKYANYNVDQLDAFFSREDEWEALFKEIKSKGIKAVNADETQKSSVESGTNGSSGLFKDIDEVVKAMNADKAKNLFAEPAKSGKDGSPKPFTEFQTNVKVVDANKTMKIIIKNEKDKKKPVDSKGSAIEDKDKAPTQKRPPPAYTP